MKDMAIRRLAQRGVALESIAEVVFCLQKIHYPDLSMDHCMEAVEKVLEKREVQNALLTGICLDQLAESGLLEEPVLSFLREDEPLYGIDEIMALSIVNIYGSIGFTNFGYLDKVKPGIIGEVNSNTHSPVNTFLDDLISAIAAAAASRIAHRARG
ncbi:MAG: phosphatidylglycerophosphatase A [Bacillota bacterium]|jgi:phosphatidylglycerophosphatase A